jgi:catechol-2,3-dioxygenase
VVEEPIIDVVHLGHLELLTPKLEESRRFFVDILGMTEAAGGTTRSFCVPGTITSNIPFS